MPAGKQYLRLVEAAELNRLEVSQTARILELLLSEQPEPLRILAEIMLMCGVNPSQFAVLAKLVLDEDR